MYAKLLKLSKSWCWEFLKIINLMKYKYLIKHHHHILDVILLTYCLFCCCLLYVIHLPFYPVSMPETGVWKIIGILSHHNISKSPFSFYLHSVLCIMYSIYQRLFQLVWKVDFCELTGKNLHSDGMLSLALDDHTYFRLPESSKHGLFFIKSFHLPPFRFHPFCPWIHRNWISVAKFATQGLNQ